MCQECNGSNENRWKGHPGGSPGGGEECCGQSLGDPGSVRDDWERCWDHVGKLLLMQS